MAKQDPAARTRRATEWPDREAARKRQLKRRLVLGTLAAVALLPWLAFPWLRGELRAWLGLPVAVEAPVVPAEGGPAGAGAEGGTASTTTARTAPGAPGAGGDAGVAVSGAAAGADAGAGATEGANAPAGTGGAETDVAAATPAPQAPLPPLADAGHSVERAAARRAAAAIPGVRSAGWLNRQQLLAVVDAGSMRQPDVAGAICRALALHGDATGITVQLQHAGASTAAGRTPLSTPCRRAVAPAQVVGAVPVGDDPAAMRARLRAAATGPAGAPRSDAAAEGDDAEAARDERSEAIRILEESTPEF